MCYSDNDRSQYELILRVTRTLLTPSQHKLLKFALSIRVYSPTVEMYNEVKYPYTHAPPKACTQTHTHMHTHMHTYTPTSMHTYTHTCTSTFLAHMHGCANARACARMHTQTHSHFSDLHGRIVAGKLCTWLDACEFNPLFVSIGASIYGC